MTEVSAWLLILMAPLSVGGAAFLWSLYRIDGGSAQRTGLVRIFAIVGAATAAIAVYLAITAALYLAGADDAVRILAPGLLPVLVVLDAVPVALAAYLRWIGRRS